MWGINLARGDKRQARRDRKRRDVSGESVRRKPRWWRGNARLMLALKCVKCAFPSLTVMERGVPFSVHRNNILRYLQQVLVLYVTGMQGRVTCYCLVHEVDGFQLLE